MSYPLPVPGNMRRWADVQDKFIAPRLGQSETRESQTRQSAQGAIDNFTGYQPTNYGAVNYGGFDPRSYLTGANQYAMQTIGEDMNRADTKRMAGLNSRGLFGSNLGGASMGRGFQDRLALALAGNSMQAAGMAQRSGEFGYNAEAANRDYQSQYDQTRMGQLGQGAQMQAGMYDRDQAQRNMYFDAMYGATTSRKAQDFQEKENKRNRRTAIVAGGMNAISSVGSAFAGK